MMTAHEVAGSFNLKKRGHEYRGNCPFCQARKMELAVWDRQEGGIGCRCYYGRCDAKELFRTLVGLHSNVFLTRPAMAAHGEPTDAERTLWARRIWDETIAVKGTLAERYLHNRGLSLALPQDIRFHPGLKHAPSGQTFPAMVAAVRDVQGQLQAIHRTFLDLDAQKAKVDLPKMSVGPIKGAAIRLAEPVETLGLAEGVETALSAMQMSELPVWSVVSAGNMKRLVLPSGVREIVIFGDNGTAGVKAAKEAAALFHHEGLKVRLAFPPEGFGDFNDVLKGSMA